MSLYESWIKKAFSKDGKANEEVWDQYLPLEQKIYEEILSNKITKIEGKVSELSEKYNMTPEHIVAFIDGLNETLPTPFEVDTLTEDSFVEINIDFEKLFKKMIEYKAEHLYTLPQWDNIFTEEERKIFEREQKLSRTIIKTQKIGRNDPCPCGSGKKYKKCCGAK